VIVPPLGFRFAAVASGIRKDTRIDLALALADAPAVAAGVFTRNLVRAAPVVVAEGRIATGSARAVLVNAGCANACTGEPGLRAARESTGAVAEALGVDPSEVLPASTGVIGALLPSEKIAAHASALAADLSADGWERFSKAILTTDRWPKVVGHAFSSGARLLGIAKGAGMIHPDVGPPQATMLAFLFTDAVTDAADLRAALARATDRTFNAASVDGDTSTNDAVIALASGASGQRTRSEALTQGLERVCGELARSMVADGEGAEHVAEIRVSGLPGDGDARAVARTIATSLLVKTALFGRDANWGRILAAAGRAGVPFDPERASIRIGDEAIVENGMSLGAGAEARAARVLAGASYVISVKLGEGPGAFSYLTSDLGHGYVDVNAGYRS
jgi:glutamate N-acetyltransferase / amino-acid N-acetyltransferase